jgi:hypothetical protein
MANTIKLENILNHDMALSYINDCIYKNDGLPKEMLSECSIKYHNELKELKGKLMAKTIGYKDAYKRCLTLQDELMVNEKLVSQVYQAQVITMSTY